MTHDPLCPSYGLCDCGCEYDAHCMCGFIAKVRADELRRPSEDGWMSVRAVLAWEDQVRADERSRKGTCWRETADSVEIPPGAIRVYREAGWFWEMP